MKVDRRDPEVARNGHCIVCKKFRPKVAVIYGDPFCSSDCCRKWYMSNDPKKEAA